ncbi:DnaJ domain-containing protein [Synechococcus sp. Nb3U1]|uniref:DnaJ C-terminal domain-containing protein n=1 Tax=Synechococcus sp. Nb3U1 TaxID=1914529 RepID=UPI001F1B0D27|nr:DnaJ C-terminal domain-containing protein [Synechococcus sp. Nb3U1]MCF2972171.1 DnaJ domain-containing protein [Synechococcus sp. Nb3U1]
MAASDFKDYYQILGVSKDASPDEIKRAYRKLARKYHPDVNPGDQQAEERFKAINEAHEVLSDPEKRRRYDQFGQYWQQGGSQASTATGFEGFGQYGSFDDFINELLGRMGSRQGYTTGFAGFRPVDLPGQDVKASLTLTWPEAFEGCQKRLTLNGETITLRIPPGAKQGSRLRVKGKGQVSPFGSQQRGDLFLNLELPPHPFFRFEGDDLLCEIPITPDEAVLGATVEIPTPTGKVQLKIPAGVDSGQILRLRGQGWRDPEGQRSDLRVRLKVVTPKTLSSEERELYEKLRHQRQWDPRRSLKEVHL